MVPEDPAVPHYDGKLQYNDRESMRAFGTATKRRVPAWVWNNKKLVAVILEVLRWRVAGRYSDVVSDKDRQWLEAKAQRTATRERSRRWLSFSEMLASLVWHYYRLGWPMPKIAAKCGIDAAYLWRLMTRINEAGRRLFPDDSLPRQKGGPKRKQPPPVLVPRIDGGLVYKLHSEGKTFLEIAELLGRNPESVQNACNRLIAKLDLPKIETRFNARARPVPVDEVVKLKQQGLTWRQIGERLKFSRHGCACAYYRWAGKRQ